VQMAENLPYHLRRCRAQFFRAGRVGRPSGFTRCGAKGESWVANGANTAYPLVFHAARRGIRHVLLVPEVMRAGVGNMS